MSTKMNRAIAAAVAASIALPALSLTSAAAAPFYGPQVGAPPAVTDVSYRHYGGGAAALGAFAAIAGTIASIAAAEHYRHQYYDGGPAPYAYGPAYSEGYAPYRYGGWGRWHHRW
jgi:hypothetical protein